LKDMIGLRGAPSNCWNVPERIKSDRCLKHSVLEGQLKDIFVFSTASCILCSE